MPRKKRGAPAAVGIVVDDPKDEYLSLFVVAPNGEVVGESIGIEGISLILKDRDRFLKIPLSKVTLDGRKLKLKGKLDWKRAEKSGAEWKIRELDPL